jgi:hypothetical protein
MVDITMITFTGPSGQYVAINSDGIVSVRSPRAVDHLTKDVRCMVFTIDGKFVGVRETCAEVRQKIEERR